MKPHIALGLIGLTCLAFLPLKGFEKQNITIRGSFDNSRLKFETKHTGRVAFIGGSITEMNGYRPMMMEFLQNRYPHTDFEFINAGISSTCSTTGAFRLSRDVLSKGEIDLLFLEFAVNDDQDAGHSREACIRGMEGIIRNLRTHYPDADVIVTYFVNPRMLEQLQKGKTPLSMGAHEEVLETYQISRIHLARELATQIQKGKFTWNEFGGTHPKQPGNRLCADMHQRLFELAWSGSVPTNTRKHAIPKSLLDKNSYSRGRFLSPSKVDLQEGWKFSEPEWKEISGSKRSRYLGFPLLHTDDSGKRIHIQFEGKAIGAFVLAGPDAGKIKYNIDEVHEGTIDLYHHYSKNLHYPRTIMFAHNLKPGKHRMTLEVIKSEDRKAVRIMEFCIN